MTPYQFSAEMFGDTWPEIGPIYRQHYEEMGARLVAIGHPPVPFNCRVDEFIAANKRNDFLHFVARHKGAAVGYFNLFLSRDMLNGEPSAWESALYVVPAHRNGVGKRLLKAVIEYLRQNGVKRLHCGATTDARVEKLWRRMGFLPTAQQMTLHL